MSRVAAPTAEAAPRVTHPVLLMNPRSGGGKATRFQLADRCRQQGIEPVVMAPGEDLLHLAEDAVARGCDLLGMAGGDGSQALVAAVAARCRIPLVVVPAGTRNHFARDLGVGTGVVRSLSAFADGRRCLGRSRGGQRPSIRKQRVDGRIRRDDPVSALPRG